MTATDIQQTNTPGGTAGDDADAWRGFKGLSWPDRISVRDFLIENYTPYEGDASFLAGPTERTTQVWQKLGELFPTERERGVLDVSLIPSSITAHAPGYIDKDHELIVGLQTDAPLKRAIMPNGGLRMVEDALKVYGYPMPTRGVGDLHEIPQDAQRGRLRCRTPPTSVPPASRTSSPACRTHTAAAASSATTVAWPCTASTR